MRLFKKETLSDQIAVQLKKNEWPEDAIKQAADEAKNICGSDEKIDMETLKHVLGEVARTD